MTTTENEDHQRWIGAVEGYRLVASDEERRAVSGALWAMNKAAADGNAFRRVADMLTAFTAFTADTATAPPPEKAEDWTPPRQSPAEQAQPWCDLTAGERTRLATWLRVRAPEPLGDHDRRIVATAEQALAALPALLDNERQRDILEQRLAWVTGKLAEMCGGDVEEGDIALVEKVWARNAQMLRIWGPVHRYLQRVKTTEQLGPISIIRGLSDGIAASARECYNDAAEQAASLGATATLLQELKDAATAQPEAALEVHAPKSRSATPTSEQSPSLAAAKAWARLGSARHESLITWLRGSWEAAAMKEDMETGARALKAIPHLLELIDDKGPADPPKAYRAITAAMERVCDAFAETDIERAAQAAEGAARVLRELREYLSINWRDPRWILCCIKETYPMAKLAADYLEKLSGLELAGLTSALTGLGGDSHSPAALTAELIRALKQAQVDAEAAG